MIATALVCLTLVGHPSTMAKLVRSNWDMFYPRSAGRVISQTHNGPKPHPTVQKLLDHAGAVKVQWRDKIPILEDALLLARDLKDRCGEAEALHQLGTAWYELGDKQKALELYQQSLPLRRSVGDLSGEAATLNHLGVVWSSLGDKRKASYFYEQALPLRHKSGDVVGEAITLLNLGVVATAIGEIRSAIDYYERAIPLYQKANHLSGEAMTLHQLGLAWSALGEKRKAASFFELSLPIRRRTRDVIGEASTLRNLGVVWDEIGEKRKAIRYYEQALSLSRKVGDKKGEATTLNNMGWVYSALGEKRKAIRFYELAIPLRRTAKDVAGEGTTLHNLGLAWDELGDLRKSMVYYAQALIFRRESKDLGGEGATLFNMGVVSGALGESRAAIDYYQESLRTRRIAGDKIAEAQTLDNLGLTWSTIGDRRKALELHEKALELYRELKIQPGEASCLCNIGWLWCGLWELRKASEYCEQALALSRRSGAIDLEAECLTALGTVCRRAGDARRALSCFEKGLILTRRSRNVRREAVILNNLGVVWSSLGMKRKALEFYEAAQRLRHKITDVVGEARTLDNMGVVWADLGDRKKALELHQRALLLCHRAEDLSGEANVLGNIGFTRAALDQERIAVAWFKLAVNVRQRLRIGSSGITDQADRSLLASLRVPYDTLINILQSEGRIGEASQVLAMFEASSVKERTRDAAIAPSLAIRLSLTRLEKKWLGEYDAKAKPLGKLGREREELVRIKERLPAQEKRLKELDNLLAKAQTEFQSTLDAMSKAFQNAEPNANDIDAMRRDENLASLAADLTDATGHPTALVATLVAKDKLFVLLALPSGSPAMKVIEVGRAELSKLVTDALLDLKNPERQPFASTKKLNDLLIAPIAKDLEGAKIDCLMFNLNGPLRYLPMGALWDGSAFLAERYQVSTFSLVARQYLGSEPAKRPWKAAFFGLTDLVPGFDLLPGVATEIEAGAKAFPSTPMLGSAFSHTALDTVLKGRDTRLVQLGTHFRLSPGSNDETFMLLGNGTKWRLSELETSDSLGFRGVELLVASACETGVPTEDDTSIEGFGAYCQIKGAKSVISTLWRISDSGTATLMSTFYRLMGAGVGKGESLHRAQLAMITGQDASAVTLPKGGTRSEPTPPPVKVDPGKPFSPDPKRPFAHPYYWAPFVLAGNWR